METILKCNGIEMGTCYYPEHWPEAMWAEDLLRMKESGINVIRIAEFAWNKIEIKENEFNYDFYDRFLELCLKYDMSVIFCTPTATPPAWLTNKYPEVLNADIDGLLYRHGARRHYNYNSKAYLSFCERIVEKSAIHYAKHPCIIGWQIDNELNCELSEFYSEADTQAFRVFLQDKYKSLDELNAAWGTVFWNQDYIDWNEIFVPRRTCNNSTNPHQVLDYYRFISDSACRFAKMQSDILRKYIKKGDFITTNGLFQHLDYQRLLKESLDFITYDSYPNFAYCLDSYSDKGLKDRRWSRHLCETRAISPIFGIMEQQSGANGWNTRMEAPSPRPGQLSLWTMQSIAHGADFVSYFRWRTCTQGTEIYWHGILDYSSRENERLREVWKVRDELKKLKEVSGAVYEAKVGILRDYDNIYDSELDVWHQRVFKQSENALFNALQKSHTPFDYVYVNDDTDISKLSGYDLLFYSHPTIMTAQIAALLEKYVSDGGNLVFGCRSAYKDSTGKCTMDTLPGLLKKLTATDVFEYSFISPDIDKVTIDWNHSNLKAEVFVDRLRPVGETACSVATYTSDHYAGDSALIKNHYGKGYSYYYGSAFNEEAVLAFLEATNMINPYGQIVSIPECCEFAVRRRDDISYMFILNYLNSPQKVVFNKPVRNLISGDMLSGETVIEPFGYIVSNCSVPL